MNCDFEMTGSSGRIRGRKRERRFWIAFTKYMKLTWRDAPDWFKGIRKASTEEDRKGADYFLITDIGEIPVDVKSTPNGVSFSEAKRVGKDDKRYAAIIAVGHPFLDHAQNIRIRTFEAVGAIRASKLGH